MKVRASASVSLLLEKELKIIQSINLDIYIYIDFFIFIWVISSSSAHTHVAPFHVRVFPNYKERKKLLCSLISLIDISNLKYLILNSLKLSLGCIMP